MPDIKAVTVDLGARHSPAARQARRLSGLRKNSAAISVMLLAQYGLGMGVNLYARAAEVCGLHVEDLDLRLDDEHVRIHGKGGAVRTVLLDDRGYVALLKLYLARAGYTAGPLFRASVNGRGGPLSYDAAHHRWTGYCDAAGVGIDIHQLRHAHATELINSGVSIEAVRRRLGHASAETTQLYALLDDKVADAEVRAARRRRDRAAR